MASITQLQKGNLSPAVSYWRITAIVFFIGAISVASVMIFLHFTSLQTSSDQQGVVEVNSSHLPQNYYPSFDHQVLDSKREQKDAKDIETATVVMSNGIAQPQRSVLDIEKDKEEEEKARAKALEKQILTDEEKITRNKLLLLQKQQELRRIKLLSRRGNKPSGWNVVEPVSINKSQEKTIPSPPTDKDFSEQGIEKDMSTFPVDLSRTVTADRNIACILIDQINSQIEGKVTCSVERNVFGFHGRNILIPAGTKIIGSHGTLKKVGDERFNISWSRLLRPDGVHVALTDAFASDAIGGTGVEGIVNRRNWEKYGGAILTSTVSVLAQMSIPSEGTNISNSVIESFSTDLGRVTAAMLNENINIKPYSVVPAGTRILVKPTIDIWLKKEGGNLSFESVEQPQTN